MPTVALVALVVLVAVAVVGAWSLASVGLALLAGGVIRNRDELDTRCDPRTVAVRP